MSEKTTITTVLPLRLKQAIDDLPLSRIMKEKCVRLCDLMLSRQVQEGSGSSEHVPLPQNYLKKVFKDGTLKYVYAMKEAGILEVLALTRDGRRVESYSNRGGKGLSKRYRIREDLLPGEQVAVMYRLRSDVASPVIKIGGQWRDKELVCSDLASLKVDEGKMRRAIERRLAGIKGRLRTDTEIQRSHFEVHDVFTDFRGPNSLEVAIRNAHALGGQVIQDGPKFTIDRLDHYLDAKRRTVRQACERSLALLQNKVFRAHRNATNDRLDHNLTFMPGEMIEVLKEDNCLLELDLKNSQFAILAWLMGNDAGLIQTNDFRRFAELVANGKLYEFVQGSFGLSTRDEAKEMMMELAFSSHRNNSPCKKMLSGLFPTVVGYIDAFKKQACMESGVEGDGAFAVWLQRTEADLFIDKIYAALKERDIWALTRHDSLLIRSNDLLLVKELVAKCLSPIGFRYTISVK